MAFTRRHIEHDVPITCCCRGTHALVSPGGYFATDAGLLRKVGGVLLDPGSRLDTRLSRWLVAKDAFDLAEVPVSQAIYQVSVPSEAKS